MKKLFVVLLGLTVLGSFTLPLQTEKKSPLNPSSPCKSDSCNLEIFLLIGQSNMAGRADIEMLDQDTLENVFLFTGKENHPWEKAANPLNKYSSIRKKLSMQRLGPGYSFAQKMALNRKGKPIGLVVNAKGGSSISEWKPGSAFYREAVKRTKEAMKYGRLGGIVWHQGESDASKADSYLTKINELIRAFRKDFNLPGLPFVAGQIAEDKPGRKNFNKMIKKLPSQLDQTAVISAKGTATIDSSHFNSASQRLMGKRYARKMLRLLKENK